MMVDIRVQICVTILCSFHISKYFRLLSLILSSIWLLLKKLYSFLILSSLSNIIKL